MSNEATSTRDQHNSQHRGRWDEFADTCEYCACPFKHGYFVGFQAFGSGGIVQVGGRLPDSAHGRDTLQWWDDGARMEFGAHNFLEESWLRPLDDYEVLTVRDRFPGRGRTFCYDWTNFPQDHLDALAADAASSLAEHRAQVTPSSLLASTNPDAGRVGDHLGSAPAPRPYQFPGKILRRRFWPTSGR